MNEIQEFMSNILPELNTPFVKIAGTFVSGIILKLFGNKIKNFFVKLFSSKEERLGEIFLTNTEIRAEIQDIIIEIRALSRCNRAAIIEYHNGEESHNGLPFNYGSMTWEKTDSTTKDIKLIYQKVPIGSIAKTLITLHNKLDGFMLINDQYEDDEMKESMNHLGTKTSYIFRITNHVKDGIVNISFLKDATLDEETIKLIKDRVLTIKELMKKMKKYK